MAESLPPPAKKRAAPLAKVTAKERVKQFPAELYEDGGVLFCRFCDHSLDFVRLDTIKDHFKSKKHRMRKERKEAESSSDVGPGPVQRTLTTICKSKDLREDFILDFLKMCTIADIPVEKTEKMMPFLRKHCKQGGALPESDCLRARYVPKLFEQHLSALKTLLSSSEMPIFITADETTDIRDKSVLNVLASIKGEAYLIGVEQMQACNHSTMSQAILKCLGDVGITFNQVFGIVTDNAAYCKKAVRDVLSVVLPNSMQILCLAHIVNLAADVFQKHKHFYHTATLITMIKSSLYKKPGRKARFLSFLADTIAPADVKLLPVPVSTRWNSWFGAAFYHSHRVHVYEGFYKAEKGNIVYGSCECELI